MEESDSDSNDNSTELSDSIDDRYWPPPLSEKIEFSAGKTVSAIAFNNAGTRLVAGGLYPVVKIWDLQSLNKNNPQPIETSKPRAISMISNLEYSNDDQFILIISSSSKANVITKDGLDAKECPEGDHYITDMAKTKGHNQILNHGCWNPKDKQTFITCSNDCTIRIWDLNSLNTQLTVIKTKSQNTGLKVKPNVCKYSRDALTIATGCNDGSIMMWDTRKKFITTSSCIKNAHLKGSEITSIDFSYNLSKLCSRSEDESCKLWDLRNLKNPIASRTGLPTSHPSSDCTFSPDDKLVMVGTSHSKQSPGRLHFLDPEANLETKSSITAANERSIVRCKWHPKINHISYTSSDGFLYVAYDANKSMGGILSSNEQGVKRKKYVSQIDESQVSIKKIITPHALPLFREDHKSESFAKIRQDPKRSYKPEVTPDSGFRVAASGSTLSSYVARNLAKPKKESGEKKEVIDQS